MPGETKPRKLTAMIYFPLRFLSEEDEEALRLELKEAFRIYDKVLSPEVFCPAARWRQVLTPSGGGQEQQVKSLSPSLSGESGLHQHCGPEGDPDRAGARPGQGGAGRHRGGGRRGPERDRRLRRVPHHDDWLKCLGL